MREKPPIPDGPCQFPGCNKKGKAKRQITAYANDIENWAIYCSKCQKYVDECWIEQWKEYFGGRI